MKIKNALKLLLANIRTVFSDLLFRLVFTLILTGIAATFVIPFARELFSADATKELFASLKNIIFTFFSAGSEMAESSERLFNARAAFFNMLSMQIAEITWVAIGIFIVIVLFSLCNAAANFASGNVINTYMSTLSKESYIRAILHNFGKCLAYQAISALFNILWTALLLFLCHLTFSLAVNFLYVFALTLCVIVFIMGRALYYTFLSNLLPAITVENKGIKKGLKETFVLGGKNFGMLYIQYVLLVVLLIYVNVSVAICTFGAGILFTLPASCVCISCVKYVNYYAINKKKYYIDYDNIIVPADLRDDNEKFLNGIDF